MSYSSGVRYTCLEIKCSDEFLYSCFLFMCMFSLSSLSQIQYFHLHLYKEQFSEFIHAFIDLGHRWKGLEACPLHSARAKRVIDLQEQRVHNSRTIWVSGGFPMSTIEKFFHCDLFPCYQNSLDSKEMMKNITLKRRIFDGSSTMHQLSHSWAEVHLAIISCMVMVHVCLVYASPG